ncbi:unnamed protein product [marine sediment metagenome]|uniref:Uncharacterized protein n=1 Tax=marine sediment metagenome TaxID=412755 RepID=X1BF76_9ZZZZ
MEIIEVSHSIANRYSNHIEINKNLKKYPDLLKPILEHELSHTDKPWTFQDFKLDFVSKSKVPFLKLIKFMFRHPASFLQLSPILYSKRKGLIIDVNLLVMYLIMLLVFSITIYIGVKYL